MLRLTHSRRFIGIACLGLLACSFLYQIMAVSMSDLPGDEPRDATGDPSFNWRTLYETDFSLGDWTSNINAVIDETYPVTNAAFTDRDDPAANFNWEAHLFAMQDDPETPWFRRSYIERPYSSVLATYSSQQVTLFSLEHEATIRIGETASFDENTVTWDSRVALGASGVANPPFIEYSFPLIGPYTIDGAFPEYMCIEYVGAGRWYTYSDEYFIPDYAPRFRITANSFIQESGHMFLQAGASSQTFNVKSPVLSPLVLKQQDVVTIEFTAQSSHALTLNCLYQGVVRASYPLVVEGNTDFSSQHRCFTILSALTIDQLELVGDIEQGYVQVDQVKVEECHHPYITVNEPSSLYQDFRPPSIIITTYPGYIDETQVFCTLNGVQYRMDQVGISDQFALQPGTSDWSAYFANWQPLPRGDYVGTIHVGDIAARYVELSGNLRKVTGEIASLPMTTSGTQIMMDDHIFMNVDGIGLSVVDVTDKTNPVITATLPSVQMGDHANSMVLVGDYLYAACVKGAGTDPSNLAIINVSNPDAPFVVGTCPMPTYTNLRYDPDLEEWVEVPGYSEIWSLGIYGDHAYCAGTWPVTDDGTYWWPEPGLIIFDVSDPANPGLVNHVRLTGWEDPEIGVYLKYAFMYANYRVGFDLSDPVHPAQFPIDVYFWRFVTRDNYLYSLAGFQLMVYDISNPRAWVQVGSSTTAMNYNRYLAIASDYIFCSGSGISVIDISSPTNPLYVGGSWVSGYTTSIVAAGYWAYCTAWDRWQVIEIVVDREGPMITMQDPCGEAFYSLAAPTLTIQVDDPHFDPSAPVIVSLWGQQFLMGYAPEVNARCFKLDASHGWWVQWNSYWNELGEGSHPLRFQAMDLYDNVRQTPEVPLWRDYTPPQVSYAGGAGDGQVFGSGTGVPEFFVAAADSLTGISAITCRVEKQSPYTLIGEYTMVPDESEWNVYGLAERLASPSWDQWALDWAGLADGYYTAIIQIFDQSGNVNDDTVVNFCKDYSYITVQIDRPSDGAWYSTIPSDFEIYMREDTTTVYRAGFTFDDRVILPPGGNWDGFLHAEWDDDWPSFGLGWKFTGSVLGDNGYWATHWADLPEGPVTFTVFATDEGLNPVLRSVSIIKDTLAPRITIISPVQDQAFSTIAPDFDISILEENGLIDAWYTVDGSLIQHHLTIPPVSAGTYSITGTIDAGDWTTHSNENTPVIIDFCATDSYGQVSSLETLTVWRDTQIPIVSISTPIADSGFSHAAPEINFTFTDDTPDYYTYTIGAWTSSHIIPASSGPIIFTVDQDAWEDFVPEGSNSLTISVYDRSGHVGAALRDIIKDTSAPILAIYSLNPGPVVWEGSPMYSLSRTELHPVDLWATWVADGSSIIHEIDLPGLAGTINQSVWDQIPYGSVTLTFYCSDIAGNIGSVLAGLIKKDSRPVITILNPVLSYCYWATPPTYEIAVDSQGAPLASIAYSFDGGVSRFNITNVFSFTGTFDSGFWSSIANGSNTVTFYAESIYGQGYYTSRTFEVDNLAPLITISAPTIYEEVATMAPLFIISVEDANLQAVYYSLDNGVTKTPIPLKIPVDGLYLLSGTFDQGLWDGAKSAVVTIQFYARDSYGNLRVIEVQVNRLDYKPRGNDLDFSLFFNMPWPVALFCIIIAAVVFVSGYLIRRGSERKSPSNGRGV